MFSKTLLLIITLLYSALVYSFEIARADVGDISVSLYSEPCAFSSVVNLPGRAVWTEKNKKYEGCFGVNQMQGLVIMYFREDRSIPVFSVDNFVRVSTL